MKDSVSIQIKEIRPDELSAYCHGLTITYGCATSLFGTILVAVTMEQSIQRMHWMPC